MSSKNHQPPNLKIRSCTRRSGADLTIRPRATYGVVHPMVVFAVVVEGSETVRTFGKSKYEMVLHVLSEVHMSHAFTTLSCSGPWSLRGAGSGEGEADGCSRYSGTA
jgi:hypothetical protein